MKKKIIIGTRKSKLAIIYAKIAKKKIQKIKSKFGIKSVEIKKITTKGDIVQNRRLSDIGGKGLFIKKIEYELLNKKIADSESPEDIRIGAILRKNQVIIPRSNFVFEKNDEIVFLAKREQLKEVENIFSISSI